MIEKQEIFTSEFLEMFGKLKEFVEKNISLTLTEGSQQVIDTSILTEEATEQPSKETIENPEIKIIAANVSDILSKVQDFNYKEKINNDLHKELQEYKNGLKESFNAPLLKAIVREYDRVNKQYCFYLEKSQVEEQSELFNKLLSEFEMLSFSLLNLLNDYDIEPFEFKTGDVHDIKLQKIVEIIETDNQQQDGTVAACVACGFHNIETVRLFRQAEVKIYKYKK